MEYEQFMAIQFTPDPVLTADKRLLWAVLEMGIRDYQTYRYSKGGAGKALLAMTEEWMDSPNEEYLYSWRSICEVLKLDADKLREAIQGRPEAQSIQGQGRVLPDHIKKNSMVKTLTRLGGSASVGEIAKAARLAWQTANQCLEGLEEKGIVTITRTRSHRSGRTRVQLIAG